MRSKKTTVSAETTSEGAVVAEAPKKTRSSRSRKKPVQDTDDNPAPVATEAPVAAEVSSEVAAPVAETAEAPALETETENITEIPATEAEAPEMEPQPMPSKEESKKQEKSKPSKEESKKQEEPKAAKKPIPRIPQGLIIRDIVDLSQAMGRIQLLNDQQIQQLSLEEARERCLFFEAVLAQVLDYDIVLSDTNIWLELQLGHSSSHSDPRINARLAFERQLEFVSKLMKKKGGRFMMMAETYEEIDRFASMQEPTDYRDADWKDEILCRNVSARLAKRLILGQQRENRLRIEGIGSESHHSAFADPVIIRRVVELFAMGKKVLLITNDASVSIRSLGMCDDLQRYNDIDDQTWNEQYAPNRPMTIAMEDLRMLDNFTRQYHFLQQAAGAGWMQDIQQAPMRQLPPVLQLNLEGFRPGDRADHQARREEKQRKEEQRALEKVRAEERQRQQQEAQRQKEENAQRQREEAARQREEAQRQKEEARQKQLEQEEQNRQRKEERRRQQQEQEERNRLRKEERRRKREIEEEASAEVSPALSEAPIVENPLDASVVTPNEQPAENPKEQPAESPVEAVAEASAEAPEAETPAESVPVSLPGFAPEDMDLITGNAEKKKRSHRGGSRRRPKAE